jgi:wobble nucleotide-excising tRNase
MERLSQIVAIKGVGLFNNAGPSTDLNKVALIYGENGRGKSTLASILRACSENQTDTLISRKTLDTEQPQHIFLEFCNDQGVAIPIKMNAGIWTDSVSTLQIFDAEFVSRNVYSGINISADHRASLLEFALGEDAVALRQKVDAASVRITEATAKITAQTPIITAYAGSLTLEVFTALLASSTADDEIKAYEKRIAAAGARDELLKKKIPELSVLPTFNTAAIFTIMAKSLPDVNAEAERSVKLHLAKCANHSLEHWVSQGDAFNMGDDCPYCGVSTTGNALIKAYRVHFNLAYGALKTEVATLERGLQIQLDDAMIDSLSSAFNTSQAHIDSWKDQVVTPPIAFDAVGMKVSFSTLRTILEPLAAAKTRQPLEPFGSSEQQIQAQSVWEAALAYVTTANQRITDAKLAIDSYKKALGAEDVLALNKAVNTLKLRKPRHTPVVVSAIAELKQFTDEKKKRAYEKELARQALDALMTATLKKYQDEINTLLNDFDAQLQIDAFSFDYRGGTGRPRSDYILKVRGCDVSLTNGVGAGFGNALSEGDKRSLAFAFFIARLRQDPKLANSIVVIDDPMCSLDRSRRAATIRTLKVLAGNCKQMIVLAHDIHFLQSLDDEFDSLKGKTALARSYCKITTEPDNYSTFGLLNLAEECATQYEKDLDLIMAFVAVKPGLNIDHVASRLRVLVEASIYRQFPSLVPRNKTLGGMINDIKNVKAPSPLMALQSSANKLHALNDYAKTFHHAEDGASPDFTGLNEAELRNHCNHALTFVFRGA